MIQGVYGTQIPVNVDSSLIDIYYCYHETRNSDSVEESTYRKIPSSLMRPVVLDKGENDVDDVVEGMYNLRLPLEYFGKKGFYTVYIKPREVPAIIADVSVLAAYPEVKGIVIDTNAISNSVIASLAKTNNALVGYRVVYFDDSGSRMPYYRLVTSNNRCEPIIQTPTSSNDKAYTYRYNDNSTLTFLTLTPSSAPTFKANAQPYIGKPTQRIALINTEFEPVMLDIEMVAHDDETIATMLEGSQLRSLDNGIVTTFNDDNEIYHQSEHFSMKDEYTGEPVYEVRVKKTDTIDFTQTIEDKIL